MPTQYILLMILILALFSWAMLYCGRMLFRIKSFEKALGNYRRKPETRNWLLSYFVGWRFPSQQKIAEHSIKLFGDKFISLFYRIAGIIFIIFSLVGLIACVYFVFGIATGSF